MRSTVHVLQDFYSIFGTKSQGTRPVSSPIYLMMYIHTVYCTLCRDGAQFDVCITKWADGFQGYSTYDF